MTTDRLPCLRWFLCLGAAAGAAILARGETVDFSGVYDDEGTILESAPSGHPGLASFGALLSLEFDPNPTLAIHDDTSRVKVQQTNGMIGIQVFDQAGRISNEAWWRKDSGYVMQGDSAVLVARTARPERDRFVLILTLVAQQRLLQVEVRRLDATMFGPVTSVVGTYLFARR